MTKALQSTKFQNTGGVPCQDRHNSQRADKNFRVLYWIVIVIVIFCFKYLNLPHHLPLIRLSILHGEPDIEVFSTVHRLLGTLHYTWYCTIHLTLLHCLLGTVQLTLPFTL